MATRRFKLKNPETMTLDEIAILSPKVMQDAFNEISSQRRTELLDECLHRINVSTTTAASPGHLMSDSKGVTRFPTSYTLIKKYSYVYTVLTGWFSNSDLIQREMEQAFVDTPID